MSYGTLSDSSHSSLPETEDMDRPPICPSFRFLVCLVGVLGVTCAFSSQAQFGSVMLTMTSTDSCDVNYTSNVTEEWRTNTSHQTNSWRYNWNKNTQGWIISAYFLGYYVMQLPVALLTKMAGGTTVAMYGAGGVVLFQTAAVVLTSLGPVAFGIAMFLSGLASATLSPSAIAVVAKWMPPQESSFLSNFVFSGMAFGIFMVFIVTSPFSRVCVLGGWPFPIIITNVVLVLFIAMWRVLVTDSPDTNPYVTAREADYIRHSFVSHGVIVRKRVTAIPWGRILRSGPVYGVAACQFGGDLLMYSFMTVFPKYLTSVRRIDNATTDLLAGLPWLSWPLLGSLVSTLIDTLRARHVMTTTSLRKLADIIAKPVAASFLLLSVYLPEEVEWWWPGLLYALAEVLMASFAGSTWLTNIPELSPSLAGVLFSLTQTISMIGPFIAPLVFAALAPNDSVEEWRHCFWLTFAVCIVTSLIYVILGSSQQQDFDRDSSDSSTSLMTSTPEHNTNTETRATSHTH